MTTEIVFTITAQKVRIPGGITEEQLRERLKNLVYDIFVDPNGDYIELCEGRYFSTLHEESFRFSDFRLIDLPVNMDKTHWPNLDFATYMKVNRARDVMYWCYRYCTDTYHATLSEDGYLELHFPIEVG